MSETPPVPPPKVGALLERVMERLELRGSEESRPVPLPWPRAETVFGGGLFPGSHVLVGANGSGKSQLAAQAAKHAARHGVPVLYVSLEPDAATQVVARWLALEAGLAWSDVYLGKLEREDYVKVAAAEASLDELPLHILTASPDDWSVGQLEAALAGMRATGAAPAGRTMLAIFDFLQLLGDGEGVERASRIAWTVRRAGEFGLRHNAAVLLLSSRPERPGRRTEDEDAPAFGEGDPARFLGHELDEVGEWAASMSVLGRASWDSEEAFLGVARQKFGTPGWVSLLFDGTEFGGGFD
jgi:hypothetical protein